MPSSITRTRKHRRSRRLSGQPMPPQRAIPISIVSATKDGSEMTVVFDQSVALTGIPKYKTNTAIPVAEAALTSPNELLLQFASSIATATSLTIPHEDPAIRNASGGYVSPSTFPVT